MKPITLATLSQSTAQEVFDWIVSNLLAQGHRSVGTIETDRADILTCVYRSPEGYKCAGGWLMGDDEYKPEYENIAWLSLHEDGIVPANHLDLIKDAQYIHDCSLPEEWAGKFATLGVQNGLKPLVVDNWSKTAV